MHLYQKVCSMCRNMHTYQKWTSYSHTLKSSVSGRRRFQTSVPIASEATSETKTTLDKEEAEKFQKNFGTWWDERGNAAALHTMNSLRVPFIRDGLLEIEGRGPVSTPQPLEGLTILDIGCGGGVLSEPLARLGASVTGIDALRENIDVAKWHREQDSSLYPRLNYQHVMAEDLVHSHAEHFNCVIASEVIEHVSDAPLFVSVCSQLIKPGGSLFITTMNKTPQSYLLAVLAAEYLFRIVPAGTHDWNKFIPLNDLKAMLKKNGLQTRVVHGMTINPLSLKWCWIRDTGINYALHAVKPALEQTPS